MAISPHRAGLRIVSDGTTFGTHVYDAETGKEIEGVRSVTIFVEARDPHVTAILEVYTADFQVIAPPGTLEVRGLPMRDESGTPDA